MSGCHLVGTTAVKIGLAGRARSAYGRRHEEAGCIPAVERPGEDRRVSLPQ